MSTSRSPARLAGLALAALALGAHPASATNFLVVIADDLGADKVRGFSDYSEGDHGGQFLPATPTLGDLSRSGLAFTEAWANPLCSPTRASLFTGLFPYHHGVGQPVNTTSQGALPFGTRTLAEALRDQGYATALFGKWHLGFAGSAGTTDWTTTTDCATGADVRTEDANPLLFGFDAFEGMLGGDPESYVAWTHVVSPGDGTTSSCLETVEYPDERYAAAAVDWINATTGPFFAVLSFNAPHTDGDGVHLAREWADLSATCQARVATADRCIVSSACGDSDGDGVDDSEDILYRYQAECMDSTLGDALAAIDPAVLADTIVVFLGDNGTPGNTSGSYNNEEDPYTRSISTMSGMPLYGKGTTFESGVRVPFLVADGASLLDRWSGAPPSGTVVASPGRRVTRPIVVADVFDTVLDLAGAPSEPVDGGSFAGCLTDVSPGCAAASLAMRPEYAESFLADEVGGLAVGRGVVRRGGWRLVVEYNRGSSCMFPSLYGQGDSFDERDRYLTAPLAVVRPLKQELDRMGVDWMPRTAYGAVAWCR